MTKDHKILSIQITAQELKAIDAEAQAPPFHGNRSDYTRSIINGRHQMSIIAAPEVQQVIDHYAQLMDQQQHHYQGQLAQLQADQQRQLDGLQTEIDQLQQDLASSGQRLNQQQRVNAQLEAERDQLLVSYEVDKFTHQLRTEQWQKDLETAQQKEQRWKSECKELKSQLETLQQQQQSGQTTAKIIDSIGQLMSKNPGISQGLEKGLGHLFSAKSSRPVSTDPTPDTQLGQAIRRDFPGPQLAPILELLQYLRDTPQDKAALLAKPAFVTYQGKLRVAWSKAQAKQKESKAASTEGKK